MKRNAKTAGCLLLFLLLSLPTLAFGTLEVTRSFDMDRDGDVDGKDLEMVAGTNDFLHLESFSANFGNVLGESPDLLTPKVMIINFDPILEDAGGKRLTQFLGWHAVTPLVEQYLLDIKASSGGHVNYIVVEDHVVDGIPVKQDGFQYTGDSYLDCFFNRGEACHAPDDVNYHEILLDFDVCNKLNSGDIDEVWLFGGPWFGYYESRLAGPDAFWYNAPPLEGTSCDRLLPIMGFNYERGVAEMLHSFGHRTESGMTEVFGSWRVDQEPSHDWDRYGHNLGQSIFGVDFYQCGTVHYPPNGTGDYNYGSYNEVPSNCEDWHNYPDLTGTTERINCTAWGCDQDGYMT